MRRWFRIAERWKQLVLVCRWRPCDPGAELTDSAAMHTTVSQLLPLVFLDKSSDQTEKSFCALRVLFSYVVYFSSMFAFLPSKKIWLSDLCLALCSTAHLMTPGLLSPTTSGHLRGCPGGGRPWIFGAGLPLGGMSSSLADGEAGGRLSWAEASRGPASPGLLVGRVARRASGAQHGLLS